MSSIKKNNKTIWIILLVFTLAVLVFYYLSNNNLNINKEKESQNQGGMNTTDQLTQNDYTLVYADKKSDYTDIYKISTNDKKEGLVFTDRDEQEKIKSAQSITNYGKILALMAPKDQEFVGSLYLLSTDGSGDKEKLQENFSSTQPPLISPDGSKITYSLFSNAESDYGFKLVISNPDGSSKREVANDQTNLIILDWNPTGDKICFIKGNSDGKKLITVDTNTLEAKELGELNENINNLDWGDSDQFVFSQTKQNDLNQTEIYQFTNLLKNKKQITKDGFYDDQVKLTSNNQYIAFYKTNYEANQPVEYKSGDIYHSKLTGEDISKLSSGSYIIGWLE